MLLTVRTHCRPAPPTRPPFVQSVDVADDQAVVLHTGRFPVTVSDAVLSYALKLKPDTVSSAPADPTMAFAGENVTTGASNVKSLSDAVPTIPATVSRIADSTNSASEGRGTSRHARLV